MTLSTWTRPLLAAAIGALVVTQPSAQTAPTIKFTETKLANGLRVILSEDHTAPVYLDRRALQRRLARRAARAAPASPTCSST